MNEPREPSRRSRRRGGRPSRRSQGHRAARVEAESASPAPVIDHPLVPSTEPLLLETAAELDELVAHVRSIGSFAYDTEFIGEETYHPRFCVIQIGTREQLFLIDPLADLDLTPVWEMIADPRLETIVHAGQQDLEPVARHLDKAPANVFDTQVAAGFLHVPYPLSLRSLVERCLGVHLAKALAFTSWDERPLSAVHARYAADDVRYLPAVREVLREHLDGLARSEWVEQECAALSRIERYRFDPVARVARLLNNRSMSSRNRALLKELVILRDQAARQENVPPRTLLADDVLLRLAKDPVTDDGGFSRIKGLPRPVRHRYGGEIIEAASRALTASGGPRGREHTPKETPADRSTIDSLWALVSSYCHGHSMDPSFVTNRKNVALFYYASVKGRDPGPSQPNFESGWREQFLGKALRDLLAGRTTIEVGWAEGRLRAGPR